MGFGTTKGSNVTYAYVSHGVFKIRCEPDTEGASSREITKGKNAGSLVYELSYGYVEAHLKNVTIKKSEFSKEEEFIFELEDKDAPKKSKERNITITVGLSSRYAQKFVLVAPNLDLKSPIRFKPYYLQSNKGNDKFTSGWVIYQNGSSKDDIIPDSFDKKDFPEWKELRGGKWDQDDYLEFLTGKFNEWKEESGIGQDDDDDDGETKTTTKRKLDADDDDHHDVSDDDDDDF